MTREGRDAANRTICCSSVGRDAGLLCRWLLLGSFEELIGRHAANLCIALFFTLVHAPVQYAPDILVFLAIVFAFSLAWGYLIQKSETIWGSVLFHAGADLLIVVGIYSTYGVG